MQVVFISNRPRLLAETAPYFVAFMPFVDEYVVFCPRDQIGEFRSLARSLVVHDENELLDRDSAPDPDHQKRNYLLRGGLARHPAVRPVFLMSDDDYRPIVPIAESYYLSGGKHQPYYFYTLAAWEEMLAKVRRRTSYDLGNLNVHRLLRRLNFSTILFSAHMPQIIDKTILQAAVDEFSGYLDEYGSLTEWETYFNFGLDRFSELFHAPRPFNVLGWPARPHWPWHVRPGSFDFENYSESSYTAGGVFFGLPDKFDPDTHGEATAEKIRRFVRLFDEHAAAQAAKRIRKETGIARRLERRARRAVASLRRVAGAYGDSRRSTRSVAPQAEGDCRFDVAGLFSSGTGLGTAASLLHETLGQVGGGCRINKIDVTALFSKAPHGPRGLHDLKAPAFDTVVACLNPPQGARYFRQAARQGLGGRRRIGYWWWEFPTFPERWEPFLADFDEIWVSSRFIHENWRPLLRLPLQWVPIDLRDGPARPMPAAPDAGRPIRLLTAFNLGSTLTRKNPAAAIAVFERVRAAARQDVSLTIKIGKIGNFPERYIDFLKLDTKQDGIDVIVTDLSEPDFGTLIDAHDMYISMHRAEGLGLPLAQAMWRGKIAVATAWSGNLEFMTPASSILVDCAPTTIADENRNTDAELPCAEPSVDDAANKILEILEDRERMAEMGRLAQRRISDVSQFAVDYNRRQFCSNGTPVQE